jgi:phage terminase large subunit-like protein
MNMTKWAACSNPSLKLSDFKGQPCYCALDLASKIDICALVLLFEGNQQTVKRLLIDPETNEEVEREVTQKDFIVFGKYYLPEETIKLAGNDHYVKWVKEGWITETPGARTDFLYIENDLKIINKENPIVELAFDPREATYLINNVSEWLGNHTVDGEEVSRCVEITQGPQLMSEAMKEVEARVYSQTLLHSGDPVFTWMMGNVVKKQGRNSGPIKSYYPTKEKAEFKIDAPVSLIMATSRAMKKKEIGSVYDGLSLEDMRKKLRGEL